MNRQTVLIVDDDPDMRELVAMHLNDQHIRTIEAGDGMEAIRQFRSQQPDLVIMDVMLPQMDGYEAARIMRAESSVPIIFLTGKMESGEMVTGLELADDYVTKPFVPDVLIARVKVQLRRVGSARPPSVVQFGELAVHLDGDSATFRGQEIPLLAKEFKLLKFFAERPRQLFDAEQLYDLLWGFGEGDPRTVMVHISNLRKKLAIYAPDSVHIETVKGLGYRLVAVEVAAGAETMSSMQEAIIEAATELFANRGYEGMTMKEVARKVGISASSIYSFFKNKEDLFMHIYRQVLDNHFQLASSLESFEHAPDVKTRFDELFRAIIRFQSDDMAKMKIYIRMLLNPDNIGGQDTRRQLIKVEREEQELFANWIKTGMERGEIKQGDSMELAQVLICILDGFFWQMQRYTEDVFADRFEQLWNWFWRTMLVQPPAEH